METVKAQDLRLGNWFNYYGGKHKGYIIAVKLNTLSDNSDVAITIEGGGYTKTDVKDLSPIPLTEDILLRLGFEQDENKNRWIKVANNHEELEIYSDWEDDKCIYERVFIYSVHELQNLFYALTGQELTLNP